MNAKKVLLIVLAIVSVFLVIFATKVTIFVVPPIGAIPEGRTLIIYKLEKTKFIDSPDAMCERIQGGVSLLCRGLVLGSVGKNAEVIARLPYSKWLYEYSTGGKTYTN